MAQQLKPVKLVSTTPPQGLHIETNDFWRGYSEGIRNDQTHPRFNLSSSPSERGIVEILQNLCWMYFDDELTEDTLRHDAGLIAGWLCRLAVQVGE